MAFKDKIVTLCLTLVVGVGILSVGTWGHNRAFAQPQPVRHAPSSLNS